MFLCPTCRDGAPFTDGFNSVGNCYRCGQFSTDCRARSVESRRESVPVKMSEDKQRAKRILDYLTLYLKTSPTSAITAILAAIGLYAQDMAPKDGGKYNEVLIEDLLIVVRELRGQL